MSRKSDKQKKKVRRLRILAALLCAWIAVCLIAPIAFVAALPESNIDQGSSGAETTAEVYAAEAGADLEIRVGYFGDDKDYRRKAVLTRDDLEALETAVYRYSNVTRVGTVMETIARGPTVYDVLDAAGIDPGSVQTLNLRTTDGSKENKWFVSLNMDQWVNHTRWYYPHLRGDYQHIDIEEPADEEHAAGIQAGSVALQDKTEVPAILAIESYATKDPKLKIDESFMTEKESYRFCTGQTTILPDTTCTDYSSMNSAQNIFGIDVTLVGSPSTEATGLELSLDDPNLVVGSKTQIGHIVHGSDLFDDKVDGTLTWTSSDSSIATVDENGMVTILKAGEVTITATTTNGISQSVTINAKAKEEEKEEEKKEEQAEPEKKQEEQKEQVQPEKKNKITIRPRTKTRKNLIYDVGKKKRNYNTNSTKKNRTKRQELSEDQGSQKDDERGEKEVTAVTPGMREIILEDEVLEDQELDDKTTPLDAQPRNAAAGAIALAGSGACVGAGGLLRVLRYLKEVRP